MRRIHASSRAGRGKRLGSHFRSHCRFASRTTHSMPACRSAWRPASMPARESTRHCWRLAYTVRTIFNGYRIRHTVLTHGNIVLRESFSGHRRGTRSPLRKKGQAKKEPRLASGLQVRPGSFRASSSNRLPDQKVMLQLSMRPVSPPALSFTRSFQVPLSGSLDRLTV